MLLSVSALLKSYIDSTVLYSFQIIEKKYVPREANPILQFALIVEF